MSEESCLISLCIYWKVQDSKLRKREAAHIVSFERITAHDEDEFRRLEEYLGFNIGREGFGKVHFEFHRVDLTFSAGHGGAIQTASTDFETVLTCLQIMKIKPPYSGLNEIYGWWKSPECVMGDRNGSLQQLVKLAYFSALSLLPFSVSMNWVPIQ